jgi:hypothetical protein
MSSHRYHYLDGNAAAGELNEVFTMEVTTAERTVLSKRWESIYGVESAYWAPLGRRCVGGILSATLPGKTYPPPPPESQLSTVRLLAIYAENAPSVLTHGDNSEETMSPPESIVGACPPHKTFCLPT